MPIEVSVVLLPIYEFLGPNPLFATVLLEDLVSPPSEGVQITPLPCTMISFASYLCTHASSEATPRSIAYASLALNVLLSLVENNMVMEFSSQADFPTIRLCRQRLPSLPSPPRSTQPPVNSILDCCILWLRHNLYRRLEVHSYTNCIWICYRIVWFLQHRRLRLDYDWRELWNSVIALLNFLASKLETLHTTGGVELLASETIRLLDLALCTSELYLPSPQALHELVYELVRSLAVLKKQEALLKSFTLSNPSSIPLLHGKSSIEDTLSHILKVASFYEEKVLSGGTAIGNVKDVLKIIAEDIEANGLHGAREISEMTPPTRSQDVLDFGRFACRDVLALMP
ncbi:hypothetical protein M413DRAFT_439420 [Hebeloma cylindrosporum]|uniref:Armadillo-like helical domain-containing protein n=1 Tax=Hebeloma cylindrosporum TaxID=76867 RepID=A0A0C3CV75_HEBCY|nr:hypothetical protein M413DRAFT_439420 [Hebeloma cylindrosporum h7]